ncbi:glycosyltransferase family 2 protein [Haloferax sulfurifontis]|uniref:Glycosyl transferase n=1 Tax=Haloferax sulfurifontis TaxID=255616 RepID=A0A830E775_9EURY|nr:glycosyltransferase family 2 protein [Haloferax sulfurifontis]GGC48706.1 glycosyl transferase [Haloferax sulfurifontis]
MTTDMNSRITAPHVVAVVLNWNNYEDTRRCLESLLGQNYSNLDVILVDNSSTDNSGERLEREFENVTIKYSDSNQGFAGGMNFGIQTAISDSADYIWLLNNDVHLPRNTLKNLIPLLESDSNIGILSPTIQTDSADLWFLQGVVDWGLCRVDHSRPDRAINSLPDLLPNQYIPMCASLIRSEVFEDVGLLPEEYFMYFEDVEFCTEVKEAGYELYTSTNTKITHIGSASSDGDLSPLPTYYNFRNRILLARKYSDKVSSAFWLYYLVSILYGITRRLYNREFKSAAPLFLGVTDGVKNSEGRGPYPK